jgi:hypothetical protein
MKLPLALLILIIPAAPCFAWSNYSYYGDWDYHGSGRDHPYSSYIDRANYVGYADYSLIDAASVDQITLAPPPPAAVTDEFTVNIPNRRGGYTPVVIKRSGDGYVGPQGEYYPEFPKVFQLEMMYGN